MVLKNLPEGIIFCKASQYLVGMSRRENLFSAQVIIWVNTILNHIDTRTIFLGMKVLAWYIDLNGIENKKTVKYPYPIGIKKCELKDDTSPTLVIPSGVNVIIF